MPKQRRDAMKRRVEPVIVECSECGYQFVPDVLEGATCPQCREIKQIMDDVFPEDYLNDIS